MTRVGSVGVQEKHPISTFDSITKGIVSGAVLGYATKYVLPLQKSERKGEYSAVVNVINEQSNKAKGLVIDDIRKLKTKSPAQDVFLKMIDGASEGEGALKSGDAVRRRAFKMKGIIDREMLGAEDKYELRNIIAQVNEAASVMAKRCTKAYDASVKRLNRPAIAYMTVGSIVGFFFGLARKIFLSKFQD